MRTLIGDMHTHTLVSGHAYGTIREMAQAAAEQQLRVLGITEHAPGVPGTVDPFYFLNLSAVPKTLYGVRVLHGSEINVLDGGRLSLEQRYIDRLDYAIAGIHLTCYEDKGRDGNTENLIGCMANGKVRIVSHPDDDRTPLDYERLVEAAKRLHVALELNNSSLLRPGSRRNCVQNYETMLSLCARMNAPIMIDSDAHDPSAVGRFEAAEAFIRRVGFPEALILNADEDRLMRFLFD